jgi:hypothetical protein
MFFNSCQNLHHFDSWKNDKTKNMNKIHYLEVKSFIYSDYYMSLKNIQLNHAHGQQFVFSNNLSKISNHSTVYSYIQFPLFRSDSI